MRIAMSTALVVAAAAASPALAVIPEGDVFLSLESGQLRTGLVSEDGSQVTSGVRVFFAEFGVDVPNVTDEPGVQSAPGALGAATSFRFDIVRAARVWNGVDFGSIASASITADLGPLSVTSPATDTFTPGFSIALDASGSHEHPDWTLGAPAADGVYLLEVQWALDTGETSPVTWMLWSQNADEAVAQASYDWAVANVPAPGAAGLALIAGLASLRRRR